MTNHHDVFSTLFKMAGLLFWLTGCSLNGPPESAAPTPTPTHLVPVTSEPAAPTSTPIQVTLIPPPLTPEAQQEPLAWNPREVVSGSVTLLADAALLEKPEAYLDLDTGEQRIAEGDIRFVVSGGSMIFYTLEPVNGGRAASMGPEAPGLDGCQEAVASLSEGNIPEIVAGYYVCAITNQGRLAQLWIDEVNPQGKNSLQISFITWEAVQ